MRRAFTVVELLVVIAIIGVLMALIVPAVQYAREAARKTNCSANLKQIAMGAIQHNTTFEYFPNAGGVDGNSRSLNTAGIPQAALKQDWGVFYQILPYIEQKAAYDLVNSADVAGQKVKLYFCPSRGPGRLVSGSTANGLAASDKRGGVDYAGNGGELATDPSGKNVMYFPTDPQYTLSLSYQNGVIIPRPNAVMGSVSEKITGASIRDGSSNVVMFGERQSKPKQSTLLADEDNGFINGWSYDTIRWAHSGGPQEDNKYAGSSSTRFGGPHTGVCMIAMSDGSTRPFRFRAVDDFTFRQVVNRLDNTKNGTPSPQLE